jgi:hypothetical protein
MRIRHYLFLSWLAVSGQQAALAGSDGAAPAAAVDARPVMTEAASPRAAVVADVFGAQPVALEQLARLRGGADTVSNDMNLSGTVANNTAINVASGMNTISNGSFSNASGLPVAIQNSGANVLIQNATIINVQVQ